MRAKYIEVLINKKCCPKRYIGIYTNIALEARNFLRLVELLDSSVSHCILWISCFTRLQWMAVMANRTQLNATCRPAGSMKNKKWSLQLLRPENNYSHRMEVRIQKYGSKTTRTYCWRSKYSRQLMDSIDFQKAEIFQHTMWKRSKPMALPMHMLNTTRICVVHVCCAASNSDITDFCLAIRISYSREYLIFSLISSKNVVYEF